MHKQLFFTFTDLFSWHSEVLLTRFSWFRSKKGGVYAYRCGQIMSEVQNIDELPSNLKTAHHVLEKDMPITIQVCYISYITAIYM